MATITTPGTESAAQTLKAEPVKKASPAPTAVTIDQNQNADAGSPFDQNSKGFHAMLASGLVATGGFGRGVAGKTALRRSETAKRAWYSAEDKPVPGDMSEGGMGNYGGFRTSGTRTGIIICPDGRSLSSGFYAQKLPRTGFVDPYATKTSLALDALNAPSQHAVLAPNTKQNLTLKNNFPMPGPGFSGTSV